MPGFFGFYSYSPVPNTVFRHILLIGKCQKNGSLFQTAERS